MCDAVTRDAACGARSAAASRLSRESGVVDGRCDETRSEANKETQRGGTTRNVRVTVKIRGAENVSGTCGAR